MDMNFDIPDLTAEQFQRFADLIYVKASIQMKPNKLTLLSNRLRKRVRVLCMADFDQYYNHLMEVDDDEMTHFIEVITTNETYFWRTVLNFEMLKEDILPDLLETNPDQELRFWSAGCSTGEEPYNLAIELTESMKTNGVFPFKVKASDLSQRVVDFAREGRYNGRKIEKIPPLILNRYFRQDDDREGYYRVRDDIKARVDFSVESIFNAPWNAYHCIFCRNVMIYFNRKDQEFLVNQLYQSLKAGGYLVIGHSESLHMMETRYVYRKFEKGVAYQRPAGEGAADG